VTAAVCDVVPLDSISVGLGVAVELSVAAALCVVGISESTCVDGVSVWRDVDVAVSVGMLLKSAFDEGAIVSVLLADVSAADTTGDVDTVSLAVADATDISVALLLLLLPLVGGSVTIVVSVAVCGVDDTPTIGPGDSDDCASVCAAAETDDISTVVTFAAAVSDVCSVATGVAAV